MNEQLSIERQLKKVKIPRLSVLALSACLTFLKPVLNLQNSRPITCTSTDSFYHEMFHASSVLTVAPTRRENSSLASVGPVC